MPVASAPTPHALPSPFARRAPSEGGHVPVVSIKVHSKYSSAPPNRSGYYPSPHNPWPSTKVPIPVIKMTTTRRCLIAYDSFHAHTQKTHIVLTAPGTTVKTPGLYLRPPLTAAGRGSSMPSSDKPESTLSRSLARPLPLPLPRCCRRYFSSSRRCRSRYSLPSLLVVSSVGAELRPALEVGREGMAPPPPPPQVPSTEGSGRPPRGAVRPRIQAEIVRGLRRGSGGKAAKLRFSSAAVGKPPWAASASTLPPFSAA